MLEEIDQRRLVRQFRQARIGAHQKILVGIGGFQRRASSASRPCRRPDRTRSTWRDALVELVHHLLFELVGALDSVIGLACSFMAWSAFRPRLGDGLIASTIAWYRSNAELPERCSRTYHGSARYRALKVCAPINMPGVQKPYCRAFRRRNASCRSAMTPEFGRLRWFLSRRRRIAPRASGSRAPTSSSTRTVQAPHTPCSQPTWVR